MFAILKRELLAFFSSMIGYSVLTVFYLFAGFFFLVSCIFENRASLNNTFNSLFAIIVFIFPIITMKLLSEEKRQKTDQLLLTAPVSLTSVTLGKYFAASLLYFFCICITLVFAITITFFTMPSWPVIFSNILGAMLLGMALIAVGLFLSSLTENQITAAICSFAVGIFIVIMDSIPAFVNNDFINKIIRSISLTTHYNSFTVGIIDATDCVFFLTVIVLFLFLTVKSLEKKRWS